MRQWFAPVQGMCRQHLLGEHVEHHMFVGSINKGISMKRYLEFGLLDSPTLKARHDEIASEMVRRGYNHNSLLPEVVKSVLPKIETKLNRDAAVAELVRRCPVCAAGIKSLNEGM